MTQRSKKKTSDFRTVVVSYPFVIIYIFAERRGRRSSFFLGTINSISLEKLFPFQTVVVLFLYRLFFRGWKREKVRWQSRHSSWVSYFTSACLRRATHTEKKRNASSSFRVHRDRQIVCLFRRFFLSFYTKSFQEMATTTNLGPGGNSLISESHARNNFKSRNGKTKQARLKKSCFYLARRRLFFVSIYNGNQK